MGDVERISSLTGDIYDAALEPALWPDVLGRTARFVGGPSAALYSKTAGGENGDVACFCGFEPDFVRSYCDVYFRMDPANNSHFFAPLAQPVATTAVISSAEFQKTRYFREWSKPQGLVDCLNVVIDKSEAGVTLLGVSRHACSGVADDAAQQRMRLIAPHIRRAVLIARQIDRKTAEAAVLTDSLDGIAAGVFLVDGTGRLVQANEAGTLMLDAGDRLKEMGGRLAANDHEADGALRAALAGAAGGDAVLGTGGTAVPLTGRDGEHYVAHVLPLTSGARRRAGKAFDAVAALFVHKASVNRPAYPEVIAKAYRLTPAELRVLLALAEHGGARDVADALGVSVETVKTHLSRLYDKTGTHRQADLVRLVSGFSNPLLD